MSVVYKAYCYECENDLEVNSCELDKSDDLLVCIEPCTHCIEATQEEVKDEMQLEIDELKTVMQERIDELEKTNLQPVSLQRSQDPLLLQHPLQSQLQ